MKLLLSAYACAPGRGSDHGVGWNWATEACRQGHEVWVLTSTVHRASIEASCREHPELQAINWVFPTVRIWPLQPGREPRFERTYYLQWQIAALRQARALERRIGFDLVHHVTWGGIRAPTFLGGLGPPLIIGPIGGGETSPPALRRDLGRRGRLLEWIRDASSATAMINPIFRAGLVRAAAIFTHTEDTRRLLGRRVRDKTAVFLPINLESVPALVTRLRPKPRRLLFAGRLLYWKGVHIAIEALARVGATLEDVSFTIVGEGPDRARLEQAVRARGLEGKVEFVGRLPQPALFEAYTEHDLFVFPSLHDAGGFVALEAMSRGLPVVCLDLGGPRDVVTPDCGIVVATAGRDTAMLAQAMAEAIAGLLQTPADLARLSSGAVARARQFILADRVREFYEIAATFIATSEDGARPMTRANLQGMRRADAAEP